MNEVLQHRLAKQYKDYYKAYNQGLRQLDEKKPDTTVQGTVSWVEPGINNPLYTKKILVGGERI